MGLRHAAAVALLPSPCLIVLAGPVASSKSTWAAAHFPASAIVSSDALRGVVGAGADDIAASDDAFALLDEIVRRRVARSLTTEIDTTGMDPKRRAFWRALAGAQGMPCVAVAVDAPASTCRARNRARHRPIPAAVLSAQLRAWPAVRDALGADGFDQVLRPEPVRVVPAPFARSDTAERRQRAEPVGLRFALHLSAFAGGAAALAPRLREIAAAAETAGFEAIYTMDHFQQIPQVGRSWDDLLESFTTLAWLAAYTSRVRLGALVAGVTYRNVGHLAKIVATLDVLSGGRAVCGLGLGWRSPLPVLWARAASRFGGACWIYRTWRGTPDHCRIGCRSCSAAEASDDHSRWPRDTPTRRTCSAA